MDNLTAQDIADAEALVEKLRKKAEAALAPLAREMKLMKWSPEYQQIMWRMVALLALERGKGVGG